MEPSNCYRNISRIVARHEKWRIGECLNLSAAENFSSYNSRKFLSSDFVNRYSDDRGFHKGAKYLNEIEEISIELARKVFKAKFVNVRPVSGHLCDVVALLTLAVRGDTVLSVSSFNGGYPGISRNGFGQFIGTKDLFFPFDEERYNIDVEKSKPLIRKHRPRLIVYGASRILFPHPIRGLEEASGQSVKIYDGSHVLGLIAGEEFQSPLKEGCSLLMGSTHKSFPGPQGGIILSNDEEVFSKLSKVVYPGLVDNIHWNRVASLGVALAEMLQFGKEYAGSIVRNSQALGKSLNDLGVSIKGSKYGFSQSHQVILDYNDRECEVISENLERANIIADSGGRLGVSEVTRMGMGPEEMERISALVGSIILKKESNATAVKRSLKKLISEFQKPKFVFS